MHQIWIEGSYCFLDSRFVYISMFFHYYPGNWYGVLCVSSGYDYLGDLYAFFFLFLSALEIAVACYLKVLSDKVSFESSWSGLLAYRDDFAKS